MLVTEALLLFLPCLASAVTLFVLMVINNWFIIMVSDTPHHMSSSHVITAGGLCLHLPQWLAGTDLLHEFLRHHSGNYLSICVLTCACLYACSAYNYDLMLVCLCTYNYYNACLCVDGATSDHLVHC